MLTPSVSRDPIDTHVGQRLKALRQDARLTQADLANALGVTFQQVQKYERGVNRLAASTLAKAAVALDCQITDFYPQVGGASPMPSHVEALAELTSLYDRMGSRQRDALLMTARAMVDPGRR